MIHIRSWLRDTLKVFIQYIAVVFSSIPATGAYFVCLRIYPNHNIGMVVALVVGFACAFYSWNLIEGAVLLFHPVSIVKADPALAQATTGSFSNVYVFGNLRLSTTLAVTIMVLPTSPQPPMIPHSESCQAASTNLIATPEGFTNASA